MNIALLTSNLSRITKDATRGPDIFVHSLLRQLTNQVGKNNLSVTAFASGDSELPVETLSIDKLSLFENKNIPKANRKLFELALISKSLSLSDQFDLYHINIGNGELILPFASLVNKPILVTLHSAFEEGDQHYFELFKDLKNVFFVPISNGQKSRMPFLNFTQTIYHGIDETQFSVGDKPKQNDSILWAGRGDPDKGMDIAIEVIQKAKRSGRIFFVEKEKYRDWTDAILAKKYNNISINNGLDRQDLVSEYQNAKLFLSPLRWEEPFGLVMIESLSCGTPLVAFAKGSVPEIIIDGETGFIVNASEEDKRGDWIIKKTGIEGLCEAVEKIYAMSPSEYEKMRSNCRKHVEENFTAERMASDYEKIYESLVNSTI